MFVTSTCEVVAPGISYLFLGFLDQLLNSTQILCTQTIVSRELYFGTQPILRLTVCRLDVDMQAGLLP